MLHLEPEWPSKQDIQIFKLFLFHYFLVPLADTIFAEPGPQPDFNIWGVKYIFRGEYFYFYCFV